MDLRSSNPFWLIKNGLIQTYPTLDASIETEVLIIGAGITGALIGDALLKAGKKVLLIDKREVATGSSAASTALIQYEIDTPLTELATLAGEPSAVRIYQACIEAIPQLGSLAKELEQEHHYRARESVYFASQEKDRDALQAEYALRARHGMPVDWWERKDVEERFSFSMPAAIRSLAGAEIDVLQMTHALLRSIASRDGRIFDRSEVQELRRDPSGVTVTCTSGHLIRCQHVIVAAGYESMRYLPHSVAQLNSSFAFVSEPLADRSGWYADALLWETARPYFYARTTADGRALFGGEDIRVRSPLVRQGLCNRKVEKLLTRARSMFPQFKLSVAFSWAGTFAETPDGLPFIGAYPGIDRTFFALCYGGNGIVYSLIAAELLTAAVLGEEHADSALFDFGRPWLPRRIRATS